MDNSFSMGSIATSTLSTDASEGLVVSQSTASDSSTEGVPSGESTGSNGVNAPVIAQANEMAAGMEAPGNGDQEPKSSAAVVGVANTASFALLMGFASIVLGSF